MVMSFERASVFATFLCMILSVPGLAAPTPPSGLIANPFAGGVFWGWSDNSGDEVGFRVVTSTGLSVSGDLTANTTSWMQFSVGNNVYYGSYSVVAFNGTGVSTSPAISFYSLAAVPGALNVLSTSSSSVTLAWPSGGNPIGTIFTAQISTSVGFATVLQSTRVVALGASFLGLQPSTTYFSRVRAENGDAVATGFSAFAATATLAAAPTAPSGLAASPLSTAISWTWIDNASNEDGLRVMTATGANISGNLASNTTFWNQPSLTPNTQYGPYFAQAFNAGGAAASSGLARYTLAQTPGSVTIAGATATAVAVSWTSGGNPVGTLFNAQISADPTFTVVASTMQTVSLATTFNGLASATSYYVRVQAVNADGVATGFISDGPVFTQLFSYAQNAIAVGGTNNDVTVTLPPFTLNTDFTVAINPDPVALPTSSPDLPRKIASANVKATADSALSGIVGGKLVEINIYDGLSQSVGRALNQPAEISFRFSHVGGIISGTGIPIRARTLAIYMLNERDNLWVKLPASRVDLIDNTVTAPAPHFSVFTLMGQVDTDLSTAYAYPVPFRPSRGDSRVTFSNLAQVVTIRVFSVSGKLVRTLNATDGT